MQFESADELTKYVLETYQNPRGRREFLEWLERILESLVTLGVSREQGRVSERNIAGAPNIWKRFYEEALPISKFLKSSFDLIEFKSIQLLKGSQPYDAELRFSDGASLKLEVACPRNGYLEHHIHKHIDKFDFVTMHPEHGVDQLKEALETNVPTMGEAVDTNEIFKQILNFLQSAINKKSGNAAYSKFRPISLILYVDDGALGSYKLSDIGRAVQVPENIFDGIFVIGGLTGQVLRLK